MLEAFDKINGKGFKETFAILSEECKKYSKLPALLKLYIVDEDKIITPMKIMKMHRQSQPFTSWTGCSK